jgi:site-specific recombinase XerD
MFFMLTKEQALQRMTEDIQMRGYSNGTLVRYIGNTEAFLNFCNRPINELTEMDVRQFLLHLLSEGKRKSSTVNVYNAAIRFFFAYTLNRTMNYLQMPRMKKNRSLPVIMSKDEVNTLIDGCDNLKHKAQFLMMYGSGLRVGELIKLKTKDIDSKSMRVFVCGKGKKDRYTILSENALSALRDYWRKYRPKSLNGYIFPSEGNSGHIRAATVWLGMKEAANSVGIRKNISPHTLRRCFATHLFESGYNFLQIKELMGHSCLKSTILYLNLTDNTSGITSPADNMPDTKEANCHD